MALPVLYLISYPSCMLRCHLVEQILENLLCTRSCAEYWGLCSEQSQVFTVKLTERQRTPSWSVPPGSPALPRPCAGWSPPGHIHKVALSEEEALTKCLWRENGDPCLQKLPFHSQARDWEGGGFSAEYTRGAQRHWWSFWPHASVSPSVPWVDIVTGKPGLRDSASAHALPT